MGTNATFGPADTVNGGGGVNTFRIFSDAATTNITGITNIQNLFIHDTAHESRNTATGDLAGVSNLTLKSGVTVDAATITITLGVDDKLTLDSVLDADAGAATVADGGISIATAGGITTTALTLLDTGAATLNTALTIGYAGTGITTLNLTAAGTANHVNLLNAGGALNTVNISGSGALTTYVDLDTTVTTVNAASATGELNLKLGGTVVRTVTGGLANDKFVLAGGYIGGTTGADRDIINGGGGTDTLSVTTAIAAAIATNQSNLTSIEAIAVSDASGAINMTYFVGATQLVLEAGKTGAATTITVNSGTTITAKANLGDQCHTFVVTGTRTDDVVTLGLDSGVDFSGTTGDVDTFTGIETLNIKTQSTSAGTVNVFAEGLIMTNTASTETVNISGRTAITFSTAVTADVINGSGLVGSSAILTLTAGTSSATVITGGEANDVLKGSTSADIINGGGGDDLIATSGGTDVITGGAGSDIFYALAAAHVGNVITDFTAGAGGDVFRIDDSGFGDLTGTNALAFKAVAAGLTASAATDNVILVQTAVAGTSAAAVEAAVNLAGGGVNNFSETDVMYVIYNSSTLRAEIWNDLDGNTDDTGTGVTLTATFDNITTLAGLNTLVAANFNVVA